MPRMGAERTRSGRNDRKWQNDRLYVGVTSNLARRIWEHKEGLVKGFTKEYDVKILVYIEQIVDVLLAITREKQLKKWNRSWKIRLIEENNPSWRDLSYEL